LNLLQQNNQADIVSNPQVLAQDGRLSELGVITEEYFLLTPENVSGYYTQTEMVTIESGTKLSITPRIGDNNDITLEMATEVSDSVPKGTGSDLPVVTRRTARNVVTVKDGGTVALAGLTENRSKKIDKRVPGLSNLPLLGGLFKNTDNSSSSREIAVFVTAHLVPDGTTVRAGSAQMQSLPPLGSAAPSPTQAPMRRNIDEEIRNSLANSR
jgi:general secretion pathway protein D